jgi:hypothetical protein
MTEAYERIYVLAKWLLDDDASEADTQDLAETIQYAVTHWVPAGPRDGDAP